MAKKLSTKKKLDDAKEKQELAALEASVQTLLARGEVTAWDVGMKFDEIARKSLHRAVGFDSLEVYADKRFAQGYGTLKRYRRVATSFRKISVKKYGTWKLDLLLEYVSLTPEHEQIRELTHVGIRVPSRDGKTFTVVAFPKATTSDLERAIQRQKAKPNAHDDVSEARAKRARSELQAAVASPKGVRLHAPLVRAHVTDDKKLRYDLIGIDEADLVRVARGLLAHAAKKKPSGKRISRSA